jgi:predicted peptidase
LKTHKVHKINKNIFFIKSKVTYKYKKERGIRLKKATVIFLLLVFLPSLLIGCGKNTSANTTSDNAVQSAGNKSVTGSSGGQNGNIGAFNVDKSGDKELATLIATTERKFKQYTYTDSQTNLTLPYNLYLPDDYDSSKSYPMVVFIADMSVVGKNVTAPLEQGYGGIIWASSEEQSKHKSIVLVPEYPETIIDDHGSYTVTDYVELTVRLIKYISSKYSVNTNRIYATGQSMGCMTFLYLASKYPDLFAAELFVSGQWDVKQLDGIAKQKCFYIVAEGDSKASAGQKELYEYLTGKGVKINLANNWDAKWSESEFNTAVKNIVTQSSSTINFANFKVGSTLPESIAEGTNEHMYSFDYAYKITAIRDWLFQQSK